MSNFFEQELRKLFGDGEIIRSPSFTGRACLGTLGKDLRVRAQFVTSGYADHYDTLKISILNRTNGPVDTLALKLSDVWGVGKKDRSGNAVHPCIWVYRDEIDWYIYRPTQADWKNLREAVKQYLEPFRDMDQTAREMGLRLVESCQQVNVYGPEWTDGMWAEIRHAMDLGIQVKTDQKTVGRTTPRRQAPKKGKGAR